MRGIRIMSVGLAIIALIWVTSRPVVGAGDETVWIAPLNFVSTGRSDDTLRMVRGASGSALEITSTATGDLKWIKLPLAVPTHRVIKKISVCYQLTNARSFISQIRLAEMKEPPATTVRHDDGTDLKSTTTTCVDSLVGNVQPQAAITLNLRLNFGNTADTITIGAIGVQTGDP